MVEIGILKSEISNGVLVFSPLSSNQLIRNHCLDSQFSQFADGQISSSCERLVTGVRTFGTVRILPKLCEVQSWHYSMSLCSECRCFTLQDKGWIPPPPPLMDPAQPHWLTAQATEVLEGHYAAAGSLTEIKQEVYLN